MRAILILMIMFADIAIASDTKPCIYLQTSELEAKQVANCINFNPWVKRPNDSDALITKKVALTAAYNSEGLAYLQIEHGLFYFKRSGKVRRTIPYDNGPDYFEEGLARTSWNGKIGFFDKQLNLVIEPSYDFAFPFQSGYSLVCNGCRKEPQGEHSKVVGGKWGFISKSGEIVVPVKFTKSSAVEALNKHRQADR